MNNLTILLTLRERADYTKTWFANNYSTEVDYLIADGSISDENESLFLQNPKDNIKYIRFPVDRNLEAYHKKVWDASMMIKTPYVMSCDNDDFLNITGIKKCASFLEENSDYGLCGGKILGVTGSNNEINDGISSYKLTFGSTVDNSTLDELSGASAIEQMFRPYKYIWYSVYRTDIYSKIWKNIYEAKFESGHLVEMFQSQLSFCFGKYKDLNVNTYIRLENPTSNDATEESALGIQMWSHGRINFDNDYRSEVLEMATKISEILKVPAANVTDQYAKFYTYSLLDKYSLSIRARLYKKLMRFFTKITPRTRMDLLIRCINFFMR